MTEAPTTPRRIGWHRKIPRRRHRPGAGYSRSARAKCAVAAATMLVLLAASSAFAASTTADFPSGDSTVVASGGLSENGEVGFFWSAARGDGVSETFTGPSTINRVILEIEVVRNVLGPTPLDWELVINGVVVGAFTVQPGFTGPLTVSYSFPSITGPTYNVTLRVTNEIAMGDGAISLAWAGRFPHSISLIQASPPESRDSCRNGGWRAVTDDRGRSFKNEGDCVSFVATRGGNPAAG